MDRKMIRSSFTITCNFRKQLEQIRQSKHIFIEQNNIEILLTYLKIPETCNLS